MKRLLRFTSFLAFTLILGSAFGQTVYTFNYTGASQTFVIPAGVTAVNVDCIAGSGGTSNFGLPDFVPGDGGRVETTLSVTPGATLNIYVGGEGTAASTGVAGIGGFNGGANGNLDGSNAGGGGGGASDIRIGGIALTDRVVVAGAGGGAARNYGCCDNGGHGGDLTGDDGQSNGLTGDVSCGTAGMPGAGGNGGQWSGYALAASGTLGNGGLGGAGSSGGGGGGGLYGGGGGSWSGGGGGSSFTDAGLSSLTTHTKGYNTGVGIIIITVLCNPINITVTDDTICSGETITLTGTSTGTGTITWDGGVTNGLAFTPTIGTNVYNAMSTDVDDCMSAQTIVVFETPTVEAGANQIVCDGEMVTLSGSGATTYSWDNGAIDGIAFTPPFGTTSYTLTGTVDSSGCQSTDDVNITSESINNTLSEDGTSLVCNQAGAAYQWLLCPGLTPVAGATSQTYSPGAAGSYACVVTLGSCTDTTACGLVSVGIEPLFDKLGLSVYPNPANDVINIVLDKATASLSIHSVTGQLISQYESFTGKKTIDVSELPAGLYILKFVNDTKVYSTRLLIE